MANMFSGKADTQIPKTLSECTKRDYTVANLHSWAERLEKLGLTLFWIIIISGIVIALSTAINTVEVEKGYFYTYTETERSFSFTTFITVVLQTALYAFIEYCAYHVLALLISALASITQNTMLSANVALYEAAKNEGFKPTSAIPTAAQATASSATETSTSFSSTNTKVTENGDIICPKCGTRTQAGKKACWSCGEIFS